MKFFIIIIFILNSLLAFPQNTAIDSLQRALRMQKEDSNKVNTLNKLVGTLLDIDSSFFAIPFAIHAKSLAQKINHNNGKALAFFNLGKIYLTLNRNSEALNNFFSALKISVDLEDKSTIAEIHNFISYIYMWQYNFPEAIKNQYKSLKIYEDVKDTSKIADALKNLGHIYRALGNNSNALKNFIASLKQYQNTENKSSIAEIYQGMAQIYNDERKFDEALKKNSAALDIFRQLNDSWSVAWCISFIGKLSEMQGSIASAARGRPLADVKFHEALQNYLSALQIFKDIQSSNDITKMYFKLGNINFKLKKFKEAIDYFDKSLELSVKSNDIETIINSYEGFSRLDSVQGNYKKAYENYKMYIVYRDRLVNEESKKKTLQTTMQYEFDKKQDSTNAVQDRKNTLAVAEIKNQKLVRNFSLAAAVAVVSFGGFSFYRYRRRRKLKSEQEMLNERLRISRELHDDMGSTLGSISIYSEVAKNRLQKNENADEAISKIGIASRELIEKMSDIVWSINPNNESFEQLQNRMQTFAAMILTPRDIQYDFVADEEIKKLKLSAEQRKNIFLIFKEAVYNIAKYAQCSKVEIKLSLQNDRFEMQIKDDGKGFNVDSPNAETNTGTLGGNGLKNMRARADDVDASLNVRSVVNQGTTIEFAFK